MKKNMLLLLIFLFSLINFTYPLVPLWNLEKSSINLLKEGNEKIISNINMYNTKGLLTKKIIKDGNEIKEENYIKINDEPEVKENFDGLDSVYYINNVGHFVCPTGTNYLLQHANNSNDKININVEGISSNLNWELKCFYHQETNFMIVSFLNQEQIQKIYALDLSDYSKNEPKWSSDGPVFFDFLLNKNKMEMEKEQNKYNMFGIILRDNNILLTNIKLTIDSENTKNIYYDDNKLDKFNLTTKSIYNHAYFVPNNLFYWMSSNTTEDFKSGYSIDGLDLNSNTISKNIKNNFKSPFYFFNKVKIIKLDMIRNTRFVYYEVLYNETKKEIYRGIIDLKINKIIFNTNENLINFKPLTNYSMLAFTNENAYEICAIKDRENGKCIDECSSGQILLDTENGNYCGDSSNCQNYILKPYEICIESCDEKFYTKKDKECGLCKDLYENEKEYKPINRECMKDKPKNTFYINEEMKIIDYCDENCETCLNYNNCTKCEDSYNLKDGKCILECNSNCSNCSEYSDNPSEQKCTQCKDNKLLQEDKGNCLNKCIEGYYESNNTCLQCDKNCKTCSKGKEVDKDGNDNYNCISCLDDKYLIQIKGSYNNCVSECPNDTKVKDNKYCIKDEDKDSDNYMAFIFIILITIIIILIGLCICKKICSSQKSDISLMDDINTELQESNNKIID